VYTERPDASTRLVAVEMLTESYSFVAPLSAWVPMFYDVPVYEVVVNRLSRASPAESWELVRHIVRTVLSAGPHSVVDAGLLNAGPNPVLNAGPNSVRSMGPDLWAPTTMVQASSQCMAQRETRAMKKQDLPKDAIDDGSNRWRSHEFGGNMTERSCTSVKVGVRNRR
jgi:hypothetical protein